MKPVSFLVFWAAFAQLSAVNEVFALTNAEFYDLIKDYVTDDEVVDEENGVIGDSLQDDDDDVIHLPGGPDDELDVEYIADKLGLVHSDKESRQEGLMRRHIHWFHWFHHHFHHHHHHVGRRHFHWHHHRRRHHSRHQSHDRSHHHSHTAFSCSCHHYSCSCTLKKTFSANVKNKRRTFTLDARATVAYLKSHYGFEITFVINGHRVYHKEISLVHPPPICVPVPGLEPVAKVCLQFYDIDLKTKRMCVRLSGVLDLKIKKFKVHLKLGCFTIPILDEQALTDLLNDPDFLLTSVQELQEGSTEVELQDLAAIYRQLQEGLVDEDSQDVE